MAEDTRVSDASSAPNPTANAAAAAAAGVGTAGAATDPSQKYPKGVVLGKDGKPCRTCSSGAGFAAWASQAKSSLKAQQAKPANDCPADVETLGRSTWTLLHSIAATYPRTPTPAEQSDVTSFMKLFSKLYPCWVCAEDFQQYIKEREVQAASRDEFGNWLCEAHNEVNRKLGKPVFDCSRWQERWRTGWKDGRCG